MTARVCERGALAFAVLAGVARVAAAAGAPRGLTWLCLAVAGALALCALGRPGRAWLDGWRLIVLAPALLQLPLVYPRLGGDGYEYYVLLRSPLLDGDLSLANDYAAVGARPVVSAAGDVISRFPIGTALVWLPAFVVAHVISVVGWRLGAPLPPDGAAPLYQASVTCFTFACTLAALLVLEALLRRRYGAAVAALAVLGVWLATPVNFYMVANPSMSHGAQVFAATLFVAAWLRARDDGGRWAWALTGAAGGLMLLVRLQDGVLLILPVLDLWLTPRLPRWRRLAAYLVGPLLLGAVQLGVLLRLYGTAFVGSISRQSHLGDSPPRVLDLMFAARHGLFTWTPLYVLAVLGWFLWLRSERRLAILAWLGFALSALVNAAMQDWWASASFGQRRLLGLTPFFAFGLAETLRALVARPLVPVAGLLAALVAWNLQFALIYNRAVIGARNQAVSLEALAAAQVRVLAEWVVRKHDRLPARIFVLLHDNLSGAWLDESPRSLEGLIDLGDEPDVVPRLVGEGWSRRQHEGAVKFRWSRHGRSTLVVPVRTPGAFHLTVRLRPETGLMPLPIEVRVNDRQVGVIEAQAGWQDYGLVVPSGIVRAGLNDLALLWSAPPAPPSSPGPAVVAVDWVRWERTERRRGPK